MLHYTFDLLFDIPRILCPWRVYQYTRLHIRTMESIRNNNKIIKYKYAWYWSVFKQQNIVTCLAGQQNAFSENGLSKMCLFYNIKQCNVQNKFWIQIILREPAPSQFRQFFKMFVPWLFVGKSNVSKSIYFGKEITRIIYFWENHRKTFFGVPNLFVHPLNILFLIKN